MSRKEYTKQLKEEAVRLSYEVGGTQASRQLIIETLREHPEQKFTARQLVTEWVSMYHQTGKIRKGEWNR